MLEANKQIWTPWWKKVKVQQDKCIKAIKQNCYEIVA